MAKSGYATTSIKDIYRTNTVYIKRKVLFVFLIYYTLIANITNFGVFLSLKLHFTHY